MALIKEQDEPGCEGLIQTIESYYKHGDKDAAGRKLLEALQRGCIVGIDLLQKLVDYVYKESSDEAKIVKLTSLELLRIDDSFRNLIRKTYRDNIKDLQCSVHGHRPYILSSKEPLIFIACCCDVLVREMHGAFSKDLEPTAKLVDEGWKLQQR